MGITTRRAVLSDLEEMLEVEKAAISLHYLKEMHEEFFADDRGEMTVAIDDDGSIMGFGKLTFQYDGSAWAELLRVDPKYQGKGAGNAIWHRYMEQCRAEKAPFVRMYTGVTNVVSKHLAEKNGLDVALEFSECSYAIKGTEGDFTAFSPVAFEDVKEKLGDITAKWGDYSCFNRTFYHLGLPYLEGLAKEGKLYCDGVSLMALGARFMPERGIHIGFMLGDVENCVAFAKSEGKKRGAPKVIIMHKGDDDILNKALQELGFEYLPGNLFMLEGSVK